MSLTPGLGVSPPPPPPLGWVLQILCRRGRGNTRRPGSLPEDCAAARHLPRCAAGGEARVEASPAVSVLRGAAVTQSTTHVAAVGRRAARAWWVAGRRGYIVGEGRGRFGGGCYTRRGGREIQVVARV